jgi:hypothetical protein
VGPFRSGNLQVSGVRELLARVPRRQLALGAAVAVLVVVMAIRLLGSGASGGGASAPVLGTPLAVPTHVATPTPPGARVLTDAQTPAAVTNALRNQEIVVVGFVIRGQADDDAVAAAIAGLASPQQSIAGVRYLVYEVSSGDRYGDLATLLGVTSTPSVVIIGSDGRIANTWTGFIDQSVISAAISQAIAAPVG